MIIIGLLTPTRPPLLLSTAFGCFGIRNQGGDPLAVIFKIKPTSIFISYSGVREYQKKNRVAGCLIAERLADGWVDCIEKHPVLAADFHGRRPTFASVAVGRVDVETARFALFGITVTRELDVTLCQHEDGNNCIDDQMCDV